MKHFVCKGCGNLVATVNYSGRQMSCCGGKMDEMTPNASDASAEKHTPNITVKDGEVRITVGRADNTHPMMPEHAVAWVCLVTTTGSQRKILRPDGNAEAVFRLADGERPIKAFAYCNLHGLWVSECKE